MQSRAAQPYPHPEFAQDTRQAFHHAHTHIGAGSGGHWLKMAGVLSPLVIGELVKDPDKRWRYIRMAAVATALVSEGMYAHRIRQERGSLLFEIFGKAAEEGCSLRWLRHEQRIASERRRLSLHRPHSSVAQQHAPPRNPPRINMPI